MSENRNKRECKPDLPLERLLPDVIDETMTEYGPQIEEMMNQMEDTP
jgi:hypothetical protein